MSNMDVRNGSDKTTGGRGILADIHTHTITTLIYYNHLEYNHPSPKEKKTDYDQSYH
jgi:hypothetical protein